jgi:hypothetical protein
VTGQKKGRGGARQGAGRKPKLSEEQHILLGLWCADEERKELKEANQEEHLKRDERHGIKSNYETIERVPHALLTGEGSLSGRISREIVKYWGSENRHAPYPSDLPEKVTEAIEAMRGNATSFDLGGKDAPPLGRLFAPKRTRLKKFRTELFERVARNATQRFGVAVSTRMVETAWKDHKKFEAEMRKDQSPLRVGDGQVENS